MIGLALIRRLQHGIYSYASRKWIYYTVHCLMYKTSNIFSINMILLNSYLCIYWETFLLYLYFY